MITEARSMDEKQFLTWLKSKNANSVPGEPDRILAETKKTGRCQWKDKDGRAYRVVFLSLSGQFVIQW
jgi:hypothetical protein